MRFQTMLSSIVVGTCITGALGAFGQFPSLKHGDGQADGKKSLGGSGEIIRFTLSENAAQASGIRIHGSRYGPPDAPKENFLIYFLSQDMSEIIRTEMAPYSLFERGAEQWVEVKFRRPVEVPKEFWIALDFRGGRTKGVYVSYDTSTGGKFSRIGLPGMEVKETDFGGDWMVEVQLAN